MGKNSKAIRAVALTAALCIIVILALDAAGIIGLGSPLDVSGKGNYRTYAQFSEDLDGSKVMEATIDGDRITFVTGEGTFVTDNPDSGTLKERLLSNGVRVSSRKGASVSEILDVVFDVIFFGAMVVGSLKLIGYSRRTFKVVRSTGVRFSDIAGMDDVKRDMAFLTEILRNPAKNRDAGIRPVKGVILEGSPGNGKTLFAKALAQETDVNFIAAKGADFQGALMGMGAMKIRMLFRKAARRKPCIVFIDEFDSIGERRNYAGTGIDKENNRIITTMLNEMDGFSSNDGILVMAATNSYASLDPALVRPGRFDLKYTIGNPDAATRAALVGIYTKGRRLSRELGKEALVAMFDGLSCSAIESTLNQAQTMAQMSGNDEITLDLMLAAAQRTGCKLNVRTRR